MHSVDWRERKGYYPWPEGNQPMGCCICGSTHQIGLEPRFNYPICEAHSSYSPVKVSHERTDRKNRNT